MRLDKIKYKTQASPYGGTEWTFYVRKWWGWSKVLFIHHIISANFDQVRSQHIWQKGGYDGVAQSHPDFYNEDEFIDKYIKSIEEKYL